MQTAAGPWLSSLQQCITLTHLQIGCSMTAPAGADIVIESSGMFAPVTSMERPPCSGGQCWRGVTSTPRLSVRLCSLPRRCPSAPSGITYQVLSLQQGPPHQIA
jgi:hypothetical protein